MLPLSALCMSATLGFLGWGLARPGSPGRMVPVWVEAVLFVGLGAVGYAGTLAVFSGLPGGAAAWIEPERFAAIWGAATLGGAVLCAAALPVLLRLRRRRTRTRTALDGPRPATLASRLEARRQRVARAREAGRLAE